LQPGYADALVNLGNIHRECGEYDEAASAYDAAIRANPGSIIALNNAGCLLRMLGGSRKRKIFFAADCDWIQKTPRSTTIWQRPERCRRPRRGHR